MAARISPTFPRLSALAIRTFSMAALVSLCLAGTAADVRAQGKGAQKKTPLTAQRKWQVIFNGQPTKRKSIIPLDNFDVVEDDALAFVGPRPGDAFQLGKFKTDGQWGVQEGQLQRIAGSNAAITVAEAEEFELEGRIDAEALGGWFWLVGWKDGTGYGLYNITFKQSGSPWFATEFDDGDALNGGEEIHKYRWKGEQPFWLSVVDKKLNLKVGNQTAVIRDLPVPNYQRGRLIVGTYDTRYGAKDLRIRSLRIRLPVKKK